jgi:Site-specific recombinase XerD
MEEFHIACREVEEALAIPEVAELLSVKRRNTPLGLAEVKALVEALQPGMAVAANLEHYGPVWRLRFTLRLNEGKPVRRSVVISDASVVEWVGRYVRWARSKRQEYKSAMSAIRFKKFWEKEGGKELAETIAARVEAYAYGHIPQRHSSAPGPYDLGSREAVI